MTQTPEAVVEETAATVDMTIAPEIMNAINQIRQRSEMLVSEIGRMEVRKSAIVAEITDLNGKATTLLRQEGERLGIPAGAAWRVTPEGTAGIQADEGSR